ncbi:helix-turn-helix transcriptional regulator [Azospirillum sp. B4]|uniref:helix-turn-helix transcriptional regulator n=1 Tax=Azospirillum sp. B4 TaxID=95605 RepID=UPI0003494829|nr:helix-turn-helix transcriptional regulator [Azospirillum sp. B4]
MIRGQRHWLDLADSVHNAALDGSWTAALAALADACGGGRGQLIGIGADRAVPFNWVTEFDAGAVEEFIAIDGANPALNPRVKVGLAAPIMQAWHDAQLESDQALRDFPVIADFARRYGIGCGSQVTLVRQPGMLIGLAVLRPQALGMPSRKDRQAFERLGLLVRQAVLAQMALEGQAATLMSAALEAVDLAAFVCEAGGRVGAMTAAAEALLSGGPLRLTNGRLSATLAVEARELEEAMAAAMAGRDMPDRPLLRTVALGRAGAAAGVRLADVIALPRRDHAFGFQPAALVVIRGADRDTPAFARMLTQVFGLTPAEADIAIALAEGQTRDIIAERRGATVETVRGQIKSVFSKLDVRRELQLAARLGRLR